MNKILYFPIYKLIHETKTYYYFYSYGQSDIQHKQTEKFLKNKYNKPTALLSATPCFPGKKVNEWIQSIKPEDRIKYKIIQIKK